MHWTMVLRALLGMREVFEMEREPSVEPSCLNFPFFFVQFGALGSNVKYPIISY